MMRWLSVILIPCAAMFAFGCSSDGDDETINNAGTNNAGTNNSGTNNAGTNNGGTNNGGTNNGEAAGPIEIISVTLSKAEIEPLDELTFTAMVRVNDENRSVQRGVLLNEEVEIGAFTEGVDGEWTLTLPWSDLVTETLAGSAGEVLVHEVVARFYDDELEAVDKAVEVSLSCGQETLAVCEGECIAAVGNSQHCGQCGFQCSGQISDTTEDVACGTLRCGSSQVESTERKSCSEICAEHTLDGRPMQCDEVCEYSSTTERFDSMLTDPTRRAAGYTYFVLGSNDQNEEDLDSCEDVPGPSRNGEAFIRVRCCCVAPPL